jgi:D-alanine-D-alanine ligase
VIRVGLIGNDVPECLPLLELDPKGRLLGPADLDEGTAERVRACARAAFRACRCRDYARIDVGIDAAGGTWALEVRTHDVLARKGAFMRAGAEAGYTFGQIASRIVDEARARVSATAGGHPRLAGRLAEGTSPAPRHLPAGARAR